MWKLQSNLLPKDSPCSMPEYDNCLYSRHHLYWSALVILSKVSSVTLQNAEQEESVCWLLYVLAQLLHLPHEQSAVLPVERNQLATTIPWNQRTEFQVPISKIFIILSQLSPLVLLELQLQTSDLTSAVFNAFGCRFLSWWKFQCLLL